MDIEQIIKETCVDGEKVIVEYSSMYYRNAIIFSLYS